MSAMATDAAAATLNRREDVTDTERIARALEVGQRWQTNLARNAQRAQLEGNAGRYNALTSRAGDIAELCAILHGNDDLMIVHKRDRDAAATTTTTEA